MLTKEQIIENLKKDAYWELPEEASNQEWQWYDEAYDELEKDGELTFGNKGGDEKDWDEDDDEEDEDW